jgi:hypothetical protein
MLLHALWVLDQWNSGSTPAGGVPARARAGNPPKSADTDHGKRLDATAAGFISGTDRSMEAVLRSTGPRTEAGKAISAMNARQRGLRGRAARDEARLLRDLIRVCGEMAREL